MKSRYKDVLFGALVAVPLLAGGATSPTSAVLDDIGVEGAMVRERERDPARTIDPTYTINVRRKDSVEVELRVRGDVSREIRFRRQSSSRQLASGAPASQGLRAAQLAAVGRGLWAIDLTLAANVDEADGLPAAIPFGSHASLVNLDYVRLRETSGDTGISAYFALHPQTRRCEQSILLADEPGSNANRFMLLADSFPECRRVERDREGDLLFADNVPAMLRHALLDIYDPIASRLSSRLGSEPGQVFVAWWPDSPHQGYRFERSWNRNSLLLFNGPDWQDGLGPQQQQALWRLFAAEQIERRILQPGTLDPFTGSASRYLQGLVTAEQATGTPAWLAAELPGWVAGCAKTLANKARVAASRGNVPGIDCGLLVQFVYDAVARSRSEGREDLYDSWRPLLAASYRRGESGAKPEDFLASSGEARRIVRGLLDGTVDWAGFAAELQVHGVQLRVAQGATGISVTLLSLQHFLY